MRDMTLSTIITAIEILEAKRDNGTMTMDEEVMFHKLAEKFETLI